MKRTKRKFKAFDVCTGDDEWYREEEESGSCTLYQAKEKQCGAVAQRRLEQTLSKPGRCLFVLMEFLRIAQDDAASRNPDFYGAEEDESEAPDLVGLVKRLGRATLDRYEIRDWHNYMKKAADTAILLKLMARGIVTRNLKNPRCRDCKHFSRSKPHVCLLTGEPKLKGDLACDEFAPWVAMREAIASPGGDREDIQPHHEEISLESIPGQETIGWLGLNPEEKALVDDLYRQADNALQERARSAKTQGKRDEYWEKHDIFLNMVDLKMKGYSEADAKSELLPPHERGTKRDSRRRQLDRYWNEIKEFLEKEVFHEYRGQFEWFRRQKEGKSHD